MCHNVYSLSTYLIINDCHNGITTSSVATCICNSHLHSGVTHITTGKAALTQGKGGNATNINRSIINSTSSDGCLTSCTQVDGSILAFDIRSLCYYKVRNGSKQFTISIAMYANKIAPVPPTYLVINDHHIGFTTSTVAIHICSCQEHLVGAKITAVKVVLAQGNGGNSTSIQNSTINITNKEVILTSSTNFKNSTLADYIRALLLMRKKESSSLVATGMCFFQHLTCEFLQRTTLSATVTVAVHWSLPQLPSSTVKVTAVIPTEYGPGGLWEMVNGTSPSGS
jgi:hypothetical protein